MCTGCIGQIISVATSSTFTDVDYGVYAQSFRTPASYTVLSSLVLPTSTGPDPYYIPGRDPGSLGSFRLTIAQWDPVALHFVGSALWSQSVQPADTAGLQPYTFSFGQGLTLNPSLTYAIGLRQSGGYVNFGTGTPAQPGALFYTGMYDWYVSEFTSPGSGGWNSFNSGSSTRSLAFTATFADSSGISPVPEPPVPGVPLGISAAAVLVAGRWWRRRVRVSTPAG